MAESIFLQPPPEAQIRALEKCIAAGDIPGMARLIEQLHEKWDSLGEPVQKDVQKLEAVFLSMVNMRTEGEA